MVFATVCLFVAVAIVILGLAALAARTAPRLGVAPARAVAAVVGFAAAVSAVALVLAHTGFFARFDVVPPRIALFVVAVTLTSQLLLGRAKAIAVLPVGGVIALQSFRVVVELGLHALYEDGSIPRAMSYSGRNFDVLVGLSAPLVAWAWYRFGTRVRRWALLWNVFSIGMLLNVVILALTSIPGPTHLRDGVAPVVVAEVPFILLPALLVSTAFASHVAVFRALFRREGDGVVSGAPVVRRSAR